MKFDKALIIIGLALFIVSIVFKNVGLISNSIEHLSSNSIIILYLLAYALK